MWPLRADDPASSMHGHSLELVTAFEQTLQHVWPVAEAAPVATDTAAVV